MQRSVLDQIMAECVLTDKRGKHTDLGRGGSVNSGQEKATEARAQTRHNQIAER